MKKIILLLASVNSVFAVSQIERILIAGNQDVVDTWGEKIAVIGLELPGPFSALEERLENHVGKELDTENLIAIKQSILSFYSEYQHPFIAVNIPEQSVSNGSVQFQVIEPTIESLEVTGNRWFSENAIKNAVGVEVGERVPESLVLDRLAWLNRNPFVHGDAFYSPGHKTGTTRLDIATTDRFPFRAYAGADNTGSEPTGNERWFTGCNASWGLSTLFTYQFTSSYDFPEFQSHLANFTFFLPWKHEFTLYGTYGIIHPEIDGFKSHGMDIQGSFRYQVPLNAISKPFHHELGFGFDYKLYNNELFFLGDVAEEIPVTVNNAAISQFYLAYRMENDAAGHHTSLRWEFFGSPAEWLPHQSASDYNQLRIGAKPRYLYSRLVAGDNIDLPKHFELSALLRVQASTDPLLPSEQFGLGGYDTVRGYLERIFLADDAFCVNLEFRTPPLSLFSRTKNELRFLAFLDYARGWNLKNSPAEGKNATLLGVGPGLRYLIAPYFTTRIDYGFNLHNVEFDQNRFGRLHFSAVLSY